MKDLSFSVNMSDSFFVKAIKINKYTAQEMNLSLLHR